MFCSRIPSSLKLWNSKNSTWICPSYIFFVTLGFVYWNKLYLVFQGTLSSKNLAIDNKSTFLDLFYRLTEESVVKSSNWNSILSTPQRKLEQPEMISSTSTWVGGLHFKPHNTGSSREGSSRSRLQFGLRCYWLVVSQLLWLIGN